MMKACWIATSVLCLAACKKDKKEEEPVDPPAAAVLAAPASDEACTNGVVSGIESTITFRWNAAANADSYELTIKDLESNVKQVKTTSQPELAVTLPVNKAYGWQVVSRSSKTTTTAKSEAWRFYAAGAGTASFAPFPATLLSPAFGQRVEAVAGKLKLDWNGSDADNDIRGYDVYLGTTATPGLYKADLTASETDGVEVITGTRYYWKVVTKDARGNTSVSELYEFDVK